MQLPAEGRQGPTPQWPLEGHNDAEARKWEALWATPQAVAWERLGWTAVVARYCRLVVLCERPMGRGWASMLAQVTALEDRLGLTPKSMRMLLWEVVSDEVAAKRLEAPAEDVRKRLRAV